MQRNRFSIIACLLAFTIGLVLSACTAGSPTATPAPAATKTVTTTTIATTEASSAAATSTSTTAVPTPLPTTLAPATTAAPQGGRPALAGKKDSSYFADALFIGDSRTEGLLLYGTLYDADFIYNKGYNVGLYFSEAIKIGKETQTAADYLEARQGRYRDVYIGFGINETGWELDNFIAVYTRVVKHVMNTQEQANIYLQAILPVAKSLDGNTYVNNTMIRRFNAAIEKLADNLGIYYLDAGEAVSQADGSLPEGVAFDGIHYDRAYVAKWQDYIQTHVAPPKQ